MARNFRLRTGMACCNAGATAAHSPSPPSPLRVSVAGVRCDSAQDRIIGVALLGAAIERLAIERTERRVEVKPCHKVRVADEGLAERDEFGPPSVEAVIRDEESAEEPLDRKIVKGLHRGATRIALDHMEIGETSTRQCRDNPVKQALRIAVGNVVLAVLRRDTQTRTHGANGSSHRVDDLEQEPHTVLNAASISVGALVGAVAQKLIDQISVRAMHLDAVEAGRKRVPSSLRILRDDAGDLRCLKRAWCRDRL